MKYEKIKYPDGQISVKFSSLDTTVIKERIDSYESLFYIKAIKEAYNNLYGNGPLELFIPCMFGQRSDRRFKTNQSFDLKIIADFINSCGFSKVRIFDPHSDVTLALINNSEKISSFEFVNKALLDSLEGVHNVENTVLVSPDAGAYKKVFEYGQQIDIPVVAANKFRNLEGKITLNFLGDVEDKRCLIVDDLCDGGYTFYLLSKALKEQGAAKVFLYVSHGYFSKGFKTKLEPTDENSSLIKCLDGIYCTNSVKDISNEYFDGYNVKSLNGFVTQYKVL